MKTIKKLIKFTLIGMGSLILLGVIIGMLGDSEQPKKEVVETSAPKEETKKITKETYDSIRVGETMTGEGGMTYDEVISMLGEPESVVESEFEGIVMETATWSDLFGTGGSITVTFSNKLVSDKIWTKL